MTKLHDAIMAGIRRRTNEFNANTFPQIRDEWTPEQQDIYKFLNGESGGFAKILESDQPEIRKLLSKLAGIDMPSRHDLSERATIPPYAIVVLREDADGYPKGRPLIQSRISGLWTETGVGSASNLYVPVRQLRPSTEDDIRKIEKNFPSEKLAKLYGAIDFPNTQKFRTLITEHIIEQTAEFAKTLESQYPADITEKGKQLLDLDYGSEWNRAFAVLIDDPAMLQPYKKAARVATFLPFCAVFHTRDDNSSSYQTNRTHVNAGINPHDIFFSWEDEPDMVGNHMDVTTKNLRPSTDEEIQDYVEHIPEDRLHLYAVMLSESQIKSLL